MKTQKTIVRKHENNFETLRRAFDLHDVCLMECTLKSTGEKVAVICTSVFDGTNFNFTPFAMMFNDNPYETLIPASSETTQQ